MPLGELLDEAFGITKPKLVVNAVRRIQHIDAGFNTDIVNFNFGDLANTSDFKRLIYLAITGKSWRGTKKRLDVSLKELLERIKDGL